MIGAERKTLVLFTESFPLGGITEQSFVLPEINPLSKVFDKIILVPVSCHGEKSIELPDNVEIERDFLKRPTPGHKVKALLNPTVWGRLVEDWKQIIRKPSNLRKSLAYSIWALYYRQKAKQLIRKHSLKPDQTIFYTFWFEFITSALTGIPGLKIVSRCHGHDLYEDVMTFVSRAWRKRDLNVIRKCWSVSYCGQTYLQHKFPKYEDKVSTLYLGSKPAQKLNPESADDAELILLSIARLSPEKGVKRQLMSIIDWAKQNPAQKVRWIQIGDGTEKDDILSLRSLLPSNLTLEIKGALRNEEVISMLENRHIDFLMLTSYSEGLPISICEAYSHGIPVIATNVGGIPEIVDESAGVLLSPQFTQEEFDEKLEAALPKKDEMRKSAYTIWNERFNSDILRKDFANILHQL